MASSLKELLAQRAALDQQIAETKDKERSEAIAKVRSLMADYGLTVADLGSRPPKAAKAVQAAIPGARLASIEGSGHALMAERPDAVLDALIAFLATV